MGEWIIKENYYGEIYNRFDEKPPSLDVGMKVKVFDFFQKVK